MDVFVVLQPVFDADIQVYAYEMLYRRDQLTPSGSLEDEVSPQHLVDTIFTYGINKLSGEKQALVKFTRNLIDLEIATLLKSEHIIVEVYEPILPDVNVLRKFRILKDNGYKLVIGDFIFQPEYSALMEFATFIKVDFQKINKDIVLGMRKASQNNIGTICYKIDSIENFENAKKLGCTYFQGDFFSKAQTLSIKDIPAIKFNLLELLSLVNENTLNFDKISEIISRDVSLSYKLLRLVNSVAFGFRNKIDSIKLAVVALGGVELKKWVSILTIDKLNQDKPDELVRTSLIRAKFAEQLSMSTSLKSRSSDLFLTGLFSMLDVIMSRPLDEVLSDIQLSADIRDVLVGKSSIFSDIFSLVISYEKCDWDTIDELTQKTNITEDFIIKSYLEATTWCNDILKESMVIIS